MDPECVVAGTAVLRAYDEMLMMLEGDDVGDIRLQNGLAAAVAGLSAQEYSALSEDEKSSHRSHFVSSPVHRRLAPHIIIYIGVPPEHQEKPATTGRIQFDTAIQDFEFHPWMIYGTRRHKIFLQLLGGPARSILRPSLFLLRECLSLGLYTGHNSRTKTH